jgi:hypothetical protein
MNKHAQWAVGAALMTAALDAMADGGPRHVIWLIAPAAAAGAAVGFLAGLWWCRRCHDKNKGDRGDHPNDR